MESTARLYNCARCHHQVTICSYCDRGNIYCGKLCADQARKTSLNAASKRFQLTRRGCFLHAERQRRYRSRCKKVTHQGFQQSPLNDPLIPRSETPVSPAVTEDEGIACHFCRRMCSPFLRLDYLHRTQTLLVSDRKITHSPLPLWAQAP